MAHHPHEPPGSALPQSLPKHACHLVEGMLELVLWWLVVPSSSSAKVVLVVGIIVFRLQQALTLALVTALAFRL